MRFPHPLASLACTHLSLDSHGSNSYQALIWHHTSRFGLIASHCPYRPRLYPLISTQTSPLPTDLSLILLRPARRWPSVLSGRPHRIALRLLPIAHLLLHVRAVLDILVEIADVAADLFIRFERKGYHGDEAEGKPFPRQGREASAKFPSFPSVIGGCRVLGKRIEDVMGMEL